MANRPRAPEEWANRVRVNRQSIDGLPALDPGHLAPTAIAAPASPGPNTQTSHGTDQDGHEAQRTMRSVNG